MVTTRDRRSSAARATPLLLLAASLCLLAAGTPIASAVPLFNLETELKDVVSLSPADFLNDADAVCVVDDVLYAIGDSVPASDPCERCQCTGASGVKCLPVQCPLRPGCRAVQRNDQCCPDFKCECAVGDRIYDNGARIPAAGDTCKVCYCRGGSVECAVLECFWRDDCEPSYEPNVCCPKFDHCPPPAGSPQHFSRPMNNTNSKMAELTTSENPSLPVVKFQQVFPTASPQPPQSVIFEESLELAETGTTLAAEDSTSTTSEESTTVADLHASRTPTQDGGPVTESAVEAPSEPSSAPENLEMSDNVPVTSTTTLEVTTELPLDLTHSEARNVESSTITEQDEVATTTEESKTEDISVENFTDMSTDVPAELRFDGEEATAFEDISAELTSDDKVLEREVELTEIPETTTIITETETALTDIKDLEFSDTFTTIASASKTDEPESRTVQDDNIETTTGQSDVGVTTELSSEAFTSDQKLFDLNNDDTNNSEGVTTEVVTDKPESREGGDIIDMIQSDKITENLETSTQSQELVTEEITSTDEPATENTDNSPEVESRTAETVVTSTEDNQVTVHTETATESTTDSTDSATATMSGTEAGITTTEQTATESDKATENSDIEGRTEKNISTELIEIEGIETSVTDETTENAGTEASSTDSETESRTAKNDVAEDSTEVNTTPEVETTEQSLTEAEVETTTDVKPVSEKTTVETEIPENSSSLISLLRSNLVPAVGNDDDEHINTDLVKNISNNMVPANLDDSKKEFEQNNPSIIDEIAKSLERDEFPFNTSHKDTSGTTEVPLEYELVGGHISDYDILSVPPARPVEAPAITFPQVSGLNDWRLAALQDQDFEEYRGPPSWQDNQALAVDFGAADFLNPSWPQQHLRRRRRDDKVAKYVQGRGRRNH